MQKVAKTYIFTLDRLDASSFSGWFARNDKANNPLVVTVNGKKMQIPAMDERPDLYGKLSTGDFAYGFRVTFNPPLATGTEVILSTAQGEVLHRTYIGTSSEYAQRNARDELVYSVEPFTEIEMRKARASILNREILDRYRSELGRELAKGGSLMPNLINILADIKTNMHMLNSAWLEQVRYADPQFDVQLPDFNHFLKNDFVLDMQAVITGNNWHKADADGRWMKRGFASSIILPNPGQGKWEGQAMIVEMQPDALQSLQIKINGIPSQYVASTSTPPCILKFYFEIASEEIPFLAINFIQGSTCGQSTISDIGLLKISKISFNRINGEQVATE